MYVVHHNILSDSFRILIVWFQPKQDSGRISFFKNRIGSDSKKTLSDYHCNAQGNQWCHRLLGKITRFTKNSIDLIKKTLDLKFLRRN